MSHEASAAIHAIIDQISTTSSLDPKSRAQVLTEISVLAPSLQLDKILTLGESGEIIRRADRLAKNLDSINPEKI